MAPAADPLQPLNGQGQGGGLRAASAGRAAAEVSPPPSLLLQPLGPPDLQQCLELDRLCLGGLWSEPQWQRELQEPQRPGVGLRSGDALLAMACGWLVLDELHITLVAVAPQWRRQGHGFRVLEALLDTGHSLGAERATLEVSAANEAAQALYGRCGFRSAGVRRRYYRDGSDALIQWAGLSQRHPQISPAAPVGDPLLAPEQGRFTEDC